MVTNVGSTFIFYLGKNSWNNVFRMNVLQDVMGDNLCFLCYLNNVFGKSFESIIFRRVPPPTHTHTYSVVRTFLLCIYLSIIWFWILLKCWWPASDIACDLKHCNWQLIPICDLFQGTIHYISKTLKTIWQCCK